jgi:hypothetical protein
MLCAALWTYVLLGVLIVDREDEFKNRGYDIGLLIPHRDHSQDPFFCCKGPRSLGWISCYYHLCFHGASRGGGTIPYYPHGRLILQLIGLHTASGDTLVLLDTCHPVTLKRQVQPDSITCVHHSEERRGQGFFLDGAIEVCVCSSATHALSIYLHHPSKSNSARYQA